MTKCFLDTNVLIYAVEREHPFKAPCVAILDELEMFHELLCVDASAMRRTIDLAVIYPKTHIRDLVHVATMLEHGPTAIISCDRGFDEIEEISRLDPAAYSPQ